MNNITESFGTLYLPVKALVVFKKKDEDTDYYVEAYDMDKSGTPVNAHPLSVSESAALSKALTVNSRRSHGFLISSGLMPEGVLYVNNHKEGFALWKTPASKRELRFSPTLGIPSGMAAIPPLVWKATRTHLYVFATREETVNAQTTLCKAPFFNIYADGRVCMGNVKVRIPANCPLEKFIGLWESYFFNSYFSQAVHGVSPVKGNVVRLWKTLLETGEPFPTEQLTNTSYTIKDLLP